MSWEDCIAEIRAAAGDDGTLSDRAIERMLEQVIREARRRSATGVPDVDSLRLASTDLAERARIAAAIEKRNALINMQTRIGRRQRIETAPDLVLGMQAEIHGINTPTERGGGRYSARAESRVLERRYLDGMTRELDQAGLWHAARGPALERQWARELFELSKGKDGSPGVTGSPEALQVAQIVDKYMTRAKTNLNQAGGWIGDYSGYITRTTHDIDKIRRAGLAEWKDSIRPLLDDRTFDYVGDAPAARERFLDNVWHALYTGVHLTHEGMQGFKDPAFTGPGNLAERLARERVLHFRDADAWLDYHEKFGTGSVLESVRTGLQRAADATGLMHHFGTNPRAEFDADLRYFMEENRNADPAAVNKLRDARQDLTNRFDFLDGTANLPANRMIARFGSTARGAMSLGHLGAVLFTHFSAAATKAAELRYAGAGLLERYSNFFTSLHPGRSEASDLLLAGLEGVRRDLLSHFSLDDSAPGTASKLLNLFFKWEGFTWFMNAQRRGGEELEAHMLGRQLDRPHDQVQPESQRLMKLYGIGDKEWELLRQAPDHHVEDGRTYLTPDAAQRIPDAAAVGHLFDTGRAETRLLDRANTAKVAAFKDDLAMRLYALYDDRSRNMIIMPDIATRADLLGGTRPGTVQGEAWRMFLQFKTWPAALIRDAWGREIYGGGGVPSPALAISGILQMAVYGTVLGYGINALKDLAKGREPRDPASLKTWGAAMMQGGGLGIFGDFIFGEYDRFGHNLFETAAGPVFSETVGEAFDVWNRLKAKAEDPQRTHDIVPSLVNWGLRNAPFINLFYTRLALDYLFLWQVQESVNPGFLRRFEKRIREQNHQNMWLSPTAHVESHAAPHTRSVPAQPWSWTR